MDDDEGLFGVDLDRRQAGLKAGHKAVKRKQGEYNIPSAGTVWVWKRVGPSFVGLVVADLGAGGELCRASLREPIAAASGARGRRSHTTVPEQDLVVLKEECESGNVKFLVQAGSVVEHGAIPSDGCTLNDLEKLLGVQARFDKPDRHRMEMSTFKVKLQAVGTEGSVVPSASASTTTVACFTEPRSEPEPGHPRATQGSVQDSLRCISIALEQLRDQTAMQHLHKLTDWLQTVKGTRSKQRGGLEYQPEFMLDAVLLSDRMLNLDDVPKAVKE